MLTSEQLAVIEPLGKPAIRIDASGDGFSRIGGLPDMPPHLIWPHDENGKPLAFLGQIALPELPYLECDLLLPKNGILYFFYDQEQSVWGFDPADKLKWRVLYTTEDVSGAMRQEAPEGLSDENIFPPISARLSTVKTYPDVEHPSIAAMDFDEDQFEDYLAFKTSASGGEPEHIIGGWPDPVQNSGMDLECQLASNGIYLGDAASYSSPEAEPLKLGAKDWTLLLQLDSDDRANMMWGDVGRLYFWIKKSDLQRVDFSNVWMILQCS